MKRFDYEDLLLQYSFFSPTTCWEMETKKKKKMQGPGKKEMEPDRDLTGVET